MGNNVSSKNLQVGEDDQTLDTSANLNRPVPKPAKKVRSFNLTDLRMSTNNFVPSAGVGYVGDIDSNKKKNGIGRFIYENGDDYEGEWKDDKKNGKGIYRLCNGDVYEGEFKDGVRCGKGIYKYASGALYSGEFFNNKMHGHGTYVYTSGVKYIGSFVGDKMHGDGSLHFLNGTVYRGTWINGEAAKDSQIDNSPLFRSQSAITMTKTASTVTSPDISISGDVRSESKSEKKIITHSITFAKLRDKSPFRVSAYDDIRDISEEENKDLFDRSQTRSRPFVNSMSSGNINNHRNSPPAAQFLKVEDFESGESCRPFEMNDIYDTNHSNFKLTSNSRRGSSSKFFEMDRTRICDLV